MVLVACFFSIYSHPAEGELEVGQAGNVEEKRHLERAGSHPNHSCEGVVWPVQVSAVWRGKRGGKQADSEGARARDRAGDQTFALWACQLPAVALFNSMTP